MAKRIAIDLNPAFEIAIDPAPIAQALALESTAFLRLLEQHTGVSYAPYRTRIVWGELLPADESRRVMDETRLVAAGIHSRRRAANQLGVEDPEAEFERWRAEATAIEGNKEQ